MEEAAVSLPWALGFYLSVVWKPIAQALQLQHRHCNTVCETVTHISYNERPVGPAFRAADITRRAYAHAINCFSRKDSCGSWGLKRIEPECSLANVSSWIFRSSALHSERVCGHIHFDSLPGLQEMCPYPGDALVLPSGVLTDKPWLADQQAQKTGLMCVCVCARSPVQF